VILIVHQIEAKNEFLSIINTYILWNEILQFIVCVML
jgi:hypothetical protein